MSKATTKMADTGHIPKSNTGGGLLGDAWDAHREAELEGWLKATPAERLAWLEDAIRLAHATGALPKKGHGDTGTARPHKGWHRGQHKGEPRS